MTDIATRIRAALGEVEHEDWCDGKLHVDCCPGKECNCAIQPRNAALRVVLGLCDMFSAAPDSDALHVPLLHAIADDLRDGIAKALCISDSPADLAAGSQPIAPAGDPTSTGDSESRGELSPVESNDDFDVAADARAERTADAQTYHEGER